MKTIILAALSTALLATGGSVFAAALSPASTQQVTVTVGSGCTVSAPSAAAFSPLTVNAATGADQDITANAVVNCTNTAALMGIDRGINGTTTQRQMKHSTTATTIPYAVLESGTNPIGTEGLTSYTGALGFTAQAYSVPASPTPTNVSITVRLPVGTTPTVAGAYTDTLSYYVQF